jgi:hypothetical protein
LDKYYYLVDKGMLIDYTNKADYLLELKEWLQGKIFDSSLLMQLINQEIKNIHNNSIKEKTVEDLMFR